MRTLILTIPLAILAPNGLGQDSEIELENLQPIDSRVADVSVLSTSLRTISPGLGPPADFDMVYRVPGSEDLLMRGNGALYAVFKQSVYKDVQGYSIAKVPPSTVFHIGLPSSPLLPPKTQQSSDRVSGEPELRRGFARAGYGIVAPVGPNTGNRVSFAVSERTEVELPRFVADRTYRAQRLREILSRRLNSQLDLSP